MNQVQRVLASNAPVHHVAGQSYKGQQPQFAKVVDPSTGLEQFKQVTRGIPFVRVA